MLFRFWSQKLLPQDKNSQVGRRKPEGISTRSGGCFPTVFPVLSSRLAGSQIERYASQLLSCCVYLGGRSIPEPIGARGSFTVPVVAQVINYCSGLDNVFIVDSEEQIIEIQTYISDLRQLLNGHCCREVQKGFHLLFGVGIVSLSLYFK